MGKGYHNYMSKKFFHPGNFENIKRVWMAQQKASHEKEAEEETLAQYQKEQEMYQNRALLGDEKAKLGLNFMYDPPPGVKRDREKEEDEPEYKFEWQRKYNAPRESYAKGDDAVRDQPFGIEVRNVRCLKCRKWGHINTDKVCPMFGKSITADFPQSAGNNPGELMEQMKEDGLAFTKKVLSRQNDPEASNQQMVDSDAEADEEIAFFLSLNRKERKKLIKKLEKERKRNIKERRKERKRRLQALKEKEARLARETETRKEQKELSSDDDNQNHSYRGKRTPFRQQCDEPKVKSSRSEVSERRNDFGRDRGDRGQFSTRRSDREEKPHTSSRVDDREHNGSSYRMRDGRNGRLDEEETRKREPRDERRHGSRSGTRGDHDPRRADRDRQRRD